MFLPPDLQRRQLTCMIYASPGPKDYYNITAAGSLRTRDLTAQVCPFSLHGQLGLFRCEIFCMSFFTSVRLPLSFCHIASQELKLQMEPFEWAMCGDPADPLQVFSASLSP